MKSLQELTANAPFQRLRNNILLWLQLLILLLVIIAATRPYLISEKTRGKNLCIAIDRSASMLAEDVGGLRIDLAKEKALEMVDSLHRGDKLMVVSFSEKAEVLCELTDDRFRMRQAIKSIQATDTRTNLRDVLFIARSLAPDNPDVVGVVSNLELFLISDGQIADLADMDMPAVKLRYVRIGESSDNAGIVAFSVRKPSEGVAGQQSFVLVHNAHDSPLETTLSLYLDDTLLAAEEISVAPGEEGEVVFRHGLLETGILRVELDHEDILPTDNVAHLVLRPSSTVKVLLVADSESTGAYFIKRALALEPRVEMSAMTPDNYALSDAYDLTIFENFAPPVDSENGVPPLEQLPAGTSLFLAAAPTMEGLVLSGEIKQPRVVDWDAEHPAMRFLAPTNIGFQRAAQLEVPEGSRILLASDLGPLLADVSQAGRQILVGAFDIAETNWPLKLSFPLFLQNLVSWVPRVTLSQENFLDTGVALALLPRPEVSEVTVTVPGGGTETVALDPMRPVFFGVTERAGIYNVAFGEVTELYAFNLLNRDETSLAPKETVSIGSGEVLAERGRVKYNQELWRWCILLALCVLFVEWWIYTRRARI
jgi:hypothetical protein